MMMWRADCAYLIMWHADYIINFVFNFFIWFVASLGVSRQRHYLWFWTL